MPRYWELLAEYKSLAIAIEDLILDPMGVLHEEPPAILLDDFRELAQATTLLALIDAINRAKPAGAKGTYLKGLSLASTLGPGIRLDIPSVLAAAAAA